MLDQGARVVVCGRKPAGLDAAVAALGDTERVLTVPAHIAKEADVDRLFADALDRFGRIAETADVVHPVLFLCSAGAGFITGQTLMVDGGASAV